MRGLDRWLPISHKRDISWEWNWEPQECTYCGSLRAGDVIHLLKDGWRSTPTDKRYKAYLDSPSDFISVSSTFLKVYFWHFDKKELEDYRNIHDVTASGRVHLFSDPEPPRQLIEIVHTLTDELIQHLRKNPKDLRNIPPRRFEELVAEILAASGWKVQLTPESKDGGYDIFAISPPNVLGINNSWIIECKRYAERNHIGVEIVRALYGLRGEMGVGGVLLATTSYFTVDAKKYKASRYNLYLSDYESIIEWLNIYRLNPEGRLYLSDNQLVLPTEETNFSEPQSA